ncbi:HIT domain-containing protein [Alteromonas sp. 345S023]|uniref:HIT domain-containing protein n=1 Tax=Alteromonas profundi TaxID=2696062 RepID=A0A7X5LP67_9ALTE|nr:HIT family protein [Alteromonas profundi]NDV93005.1 HIT domain-containing protein [Alteromonas profundi]
MFKLDARLAADTHWVGDLPLCHVLLMNDSQFPWLILVPRIADVTEVFELPEEQQQQLLNESMLVSKALKNQTQCDKINIGAIGNVVSQLHIHHVARFKDDVAWPKPVWGAQPAVAYTQPQSEALISTYRQLLAL